MKKSGKCPKCGGTDIIANAKVIERCTLESITVATYGNPGALIFKDKKGTSISALVCAECGFIECYADNPASIKI